MNPVDSASEECRYWSPYVAGIGIGLTLLLTFYIMGHGLGASGAYTQLTAKLLQRVTPDHVQTNEYLKDYLGGSFWRSWIVIEMLGVFLGGLLGALTAGRFRLQIERGPHAGRRSRLFLALGGGIAVGFGSRLALGCTSGQALSGGAVLAVGSWLFTFTFFLGGYIFAMFVKREWR
ncbi:MAG: YeeE/YedE family protein [Candidatus Methylomirabilis oxyfera]|nr:YeeE/YedE family protein [Candidatus Methylomirabilis oxyfera]